MSDITATPLQPGRYLALADVAQDLGLKSRAAVYNLIHKGELDAVAVGATGKALRVTRRSYEAYCRRIEEEGRRRFRVAS